MKLTSYWLDTAKPAGDFRHQDLPASVDVAVVGGGLTGLSTALHLAKQGASVAVLEAHTLGWGASGRNGGMATTGLAIDFTKAVERYGLDDATRMFKLYDEAIDTVENMVEAEGIDCDFERVGKLNLACKPAHYDEFERSADLLARHADHQMTLVPRSRIREEIGSDFYSGAMVDPLGAAVHVGKLCSGLAMAASQYGASLHEDCEVVKLVRIGDRRHRVVTSQGSLVAESVVVGTSGYSGKLLPWLRRRIVPIGSFIVVTEPLDRAVLDEVLPKRRVASDSKNLTYYFRITPDGRLLFGGRARFAMSNPGSDLRSGDILRQAVTKVFPILRGVGIDYCWGGLVDMSLDQMVHAGWKDGVFYSVGYSGHGVQMATHMGKVVSQVLGGDTGANPWGDLTFRAVPGHVGPPWFLPPVGAYYRFLDLVK
ncbi:NAD(P)/FAD-dependent oxidoreductase [Kribbella sp. NPDC059898]|uniref:NAD(P)/FAD-dependent oxidoreductase n=1 Tax=Kribbella sp. NPDC059898 TaxID=3346995 RepID=UPI0036645FDF